MSADSPTITTTTASKRNVQAFSRHSTSQQLSSSSLPILLLSTPDNKNSSNRSDSAASASATPNTSTSAATSGAAAAAASNDNQLTIASSEIVDRDRHNNGNDANQNDKDIDNDSGKSSCSPTQLDRSIDSGISGIVSEVSDMQLHKRIQQCKRILIALERDKEAYHILRDKLWKIVEKKSKRSSGAEDICNVCCADINIDDIKSFVACYTCNKRVCRGIKCADWIPKTAQWQCQLCQTSKESLALTSSWVADQLSFNRQKMIYPMRARSEIFIPISNFHENNFEFESASQIGANSNITAELKIQIREYVEEIVAELLGGSLDKISVGKLSKSENYLPAILNGRSQSLEPDIISKGRESIDENVNNLSNVSHERLRRLIESIIAETMRTPNLLNGNAAVSEMALDTRSNGSFNMIPIANGKAGRRHRTEHYFEPKLYQDLLATAVLNKIVQTHGNNGNENASESRRMSESTPDLSIGHRSERDANYNIENQSTTSGSSIEPRSDSSYSDIDQAGNIEKIVSPLSPKVSKLDLSVGDAIMMGRESALSDYIASHMVPLPDLSAAATESEGDEISASSSTLAEGTWEDNWLFKKRDSSSITAAVTGSAMLVPAPKEVVRAQIGDKAADEVSDLSEIGSETDDSSIDLLRGEVDPMNERVLNKHLIGGLNTKDILDEILDNVSVSSTTVAPDTEATITETRNEPVIETAITLSTEAVNSNVTSSQAIVESPVELSSPAKFEDLSKSPDIHLANPVVGSIAEREYKKWYNAVDMPNNPYAPEALKKRISGSQERFMDIPNISPSIESNPITQLQDGDNVAAPVPDELNSSRDVDTKRYSRDYYINDAKLSTASAKSPQSMMMSKEIANPIAEDDIIINEVIPNGSSSNNSPQQQHRHDSNAFHWTLSTPVRRSSSLKFINQNRHSSPPQQQHHNNNNRHNRFSTTTTLPLLPSSTKLDSCNNILPKCAAVTSASTNENNDDDDENGDYYDDETFDLRSQHSWKSAYSSSLSKNAPKRRTPSLLSSAHSSGSVGSLNSNSISSKKHSQQPNANILSQFEKQLLHKDLKRNSFRAISATTKDFVMNPIYDREQFFINNDDKRKQGPNLNIDDQADSGVDSCLNGFSEIDAKNSNSSLLF